MAGGTAPPSVEMHFACRGLLGRRLLTAWRPEEPMEPGRDGDQGLGDVGTSRRQPPHVSHGREAPVARHGGECLRLAGYTHPQGGWGSTVQGPPERATT